MQIKSLIAMPILFVCLFSVSAFAKNNESNPGDPIVLEAASTAPLRLNFSPKVVGEYNAQGGTDGNRQWFSIVTYHNGGEYFYATTSGMTAIYKKKRSTGTEKLTDAKVPASKEDEDSDEEVCDTEDPPNCRPRSWDSGWAK